MAKIEKIQSEKVMYISSDIVQMKAESQTDVSLMDTAQIPLYLVNKRAPVAMITQNWNMQTKAVNQTEQTLHLYLQVPINMNKALRPTKP
jgi:hypothetical protein